jgi:hypothetical protein
VDSDSSAVGEDVLWLQVVSLRQPKGEMSSREEHRFEHGLGEFGAASILPATKPKWRISGATNRRKRSVVNDLTPRLRRQRKSDSHLVHSPFHKIKSACTEGFAFPIIHK